MKTFDTGVLLDLLGGSRFLARTGARNIQAIDNGISLDVPQKLTREGISKVEILLDESGLYKMNFLRVHPRTHRLVLVDDVVGVPPDKVAEEFLDVTNLDNLKTKFSFPLVPV